MALFRNRFDAGRQLATLLKADYDLILALPRGGVPLAFEIASTLNIPMDLLLVRKLSCPGSPELALGAISNHGEVFLNQDLIQELGIKQSEIDAIINTQAQEIKRRELLYRGTRPPLDLSNKRILLIDDGVATGASMGVAIEAVRAAKPKRIDCALPVIPADTLEKLSPLVDELIYIDAPQLFFAVGQFYQNFDQVSDEEVVELMKKCDNGAI